MKPRIYADVREERTGIPSILESLGLTVIRKQLSIGDYIIPGEVAIERKTAPDFARSLFDGRLFDQARRMHESYHTIIYIVEGDPARLRRYQSRIKQLYSALVTLMLDYNAKVITSTDPQATAIIIDAIARRLMRETAPAAIIHKKPKIEDLSDWQLYIIQSFPSIGPRTAEKILQRMGTIERFCRASIAELSKIEGVGEKKAEFIKRILVTPYKGRSSARRMMGKLDDYY